jgi:CRP-like cAMP-binding protein
LSRSSARCTASAPGICRGRQVQVDAAGAARQRRADGAGDADADVLRVQHAVGGLAQRLGDGELVHLLVVALLQVDDLALAGAGDQDHREAVGRGVGQRGEAVEETGRRHRHADAGLLRQETGGGRGVARVLLVAERDQAHALGLRLAGEVRDRDPGQGVDVLDAVELQGVDQQVETVGLVAGLGVVCHGWKSLWKIQQRGPRRVVLHRRVIIGIAPASTLDPGQFSVYFGAAQAPPALPPSSSMAPLSVQDHPERNVIRVQLGQNVVLKAMNSGQTAELESRLMIVDCQKGDSLLTQGVHEMEQYFILDGILKRVVTNQEAKEMILRFAAERDMETSYAAWRLGTPTPYSIVCVTKARVAKLPLQDWVAFLDRHHGLKETFEYSVMELMSEIMAHTITLHLLDAPGRVKRFLRKHPELFDRIPKKELASYLNLSAETLSRLKQRGKI